MRKKELLILILAIILCSTTAYSASGQAVYYERDGIRYYRWSTWDYVQTTEKENGYYSGEITVPPEITVGSKTYPVKQIHGFQNCANLTKINIPSSVEWIGEFNGCTSLSEIIIPSSVKNIYYKAFKGCISLKRVVLGDGLKTIPACCFEDCSKLEKIDIPSNIVTIGGYAFAGCVSLNEVNFDRDSKLSTIENNAFEKCINLPSMVIPNSTNTIEHEAFYGCVNMESLTIGSGLEKMGDSVFEGCKKLNSVTILDGVAEIGRSAFKGCVSLPKVNIPNSVKTLGNGAFMNCAGLITVELGNGVNELGNEAFADCSSLLEIKIPQNVTTIGNSCFSGCVNLKVVRLFTQNVKNWFAGFGSITDIYIGNTVESVDDSAFKDCKNLERVFFDENSNLKVIDKYAFSRCYLLKKVMLPESVTTLGVEAFRDCRAVEELSLPSTLNSIGVYAFNGCESLTKVYAYMPIPFAIDANVFSAKTYNNAVLEVNKNEDKYRETFAWSKFFHIVKIGNKPGEGDGGKESDNYKKGGGGTVTTRSSIYDITAIGMGEVVVDKKTKSSGKGWTSSFSGLNMREEQLTVKIAHYPDSGVPFKFIPDAGYMVKQVQFRPEKNGTLKDVTNAIVFDPTISGYTYKAFDKDTGPKLVVTFEKATNPVLSKTKASIEKGKTLTLKATESSPYKTVTWKSSNTKVATVSSNGKVKGVKAGTATITCTSVATGLSSKCKVTVGYVTLDKTEAIVKKGKTLTLTPTVYPTTLADQSVTWTSSDTKIATVSSAGKVKGVKVGTATITCTSVATSLSTACTVTVGAVTLSKTTAAIKKGKTLTLTAKVYPTTLEDKSVTWKSSNTKIATVTSAGKVKGVKVGTATITCTSVATGLSATCKVTVGAVTLDKKEMVLEKGKTATLKTTITPTTLEDKSVTWTSSDTKIATVSSKGKVKGVKAGTATITCTSVATGLSATCKVTVGKVVIGVSELTIKKSRTVTLTATVYPTTLADRSVTWESSDTKVATVSSTGKVKGVKAGTATITCTSVATGLSSTCTITVLAASESRSMEGDDDETTGIESHEVPAATEPFDVYDLGGRKVRSQVTSLDGLPAGIYIVNGKKMVIR